MLHEQSFIPSTTDLPALWRSRAGELRRYGADPQALMAERLADELDAALRRHDDELLTLDQAAQESGYNAESLGRLVRERRIPNAGRPRAPRIRRADLPHKPAGVATAPVAAYDPVADARSLRNRASRRSA